MASNIDEFLAAKSRAAAVHDGLIPAETYFHTLASASRIHILHFIAAGAKDTRTIASEIGCTYENCQKHLKRLLHIGVIKKEVGVGRMTSKGAHPVFLYSLNDENHFDRTLSEHIREGLSRGNDKRNDVVLVPRHVSYHIPSDNFDEHFQSGGEVA